MTPEGNFVIGSNGNLALVEGDEELLQRVVMRLKTYRGDYTLSPTVGAGLEDFIGKPISGSVLESIKARCVNEINQINLGLLNEIYVSETADNTVGIAILLNSLSSPKKYLEVILELDLVSGKVYSREE